MIESLAASHAKGKGTTGDVIFGVAALAAKAVQQHGKDKVVNATIGAILDDNESLVILPTVEKAWRQLPMQEVANYAPIPGLPEYLDAAIHLTFADSRPDAYIKAVATSGGSGVLHHVIWNYSELGDTVLTSDWYWGPYKVLCEDSLRKLDTFTLFDEKQGFNLPAFTAKVQELLAKQDSLIVILNAPAHNPTGYSLTDSEWEQVIAFFRECATDQTKRIIPLIDIAYLDYAGEKQAARAFMKKLGGLPANVLPILAFSMSKGYTMYGQRTGAMIGVSSSQKVIQEFADINQCTSRATWSNINRGCMRMLANICADSAMQAQMEAERDVFYRMIQERAAIFTQEAKAANLNMLPYVAGFFITVPADKPEAVCEKLREDLIFGVALGKSIRIAVCAVPQEKIKGVAEKMATAMASVG